MNIGKYNYTIEARDIDYTGNATFVALCDHILKAAGEDADKNGFGVKDLNCENCSWVLSRMAVEFHRKVVQYEQLTVETWVNDVGRMMTTRNMNIYDDQGDLLGSCVTQWAIIDLDKRVPLDIREHVDHRGKVTDRPSPIEKPHKIIRVSPQEHSSHKVVYSDLDFNGHVNSMKYVTWMLDMVPLDYFQSKLLVRADINFLHECRYGEEVVTGYGQDEYSVFEIKHSATDSPLCRARFAWRDI